MPARITRISFIYYFSSMTNFPWKEERAGHVDEYNVMKSTAKEENIGAQEENETRDERSAGAYTPAGRKYGKRRPASFSSIRFELLSSRRALSIVAENYFIIARSAGLKCSRKGPARRRRESREVRKRDPVEREERLCSARDSAIYWSCEGKPQVHLEKPAIIYQKESIP